METEYLTGTIACEIAYIEQKIAYFQQKIAYFALDPELLNRLIH